MKWLESKKGKELRRNGKRWNPQLTPFMLLTGRCLVNSHAIWFGAVYQSRTNEPLEGELLFSVVL